MVVVYDVEYWFVLVHLFCPIFVCRHGIQVSIRMGHVIKDWLDTISMIMVTNNKRA